MNYGLTFEPIKGKSDKIQTTFGYSFKVWNENGEEKAYRISAGFTFDGASVPKILWSTVGHPLSPRFLEAGLRHDYLYRTGKVSREVADRVLYETLRDWGVPRWRSWLMYAGVRAFGFVFYNKYNPHKK